MKLDPKTTAMLSLDFQQGVIANISGSDAVIQNASRALEFGRKMNYRIIHVGLEFSEGHPEIPDTGAMRARVEDKNLYVRGTPSVEFPSIARPGELVVYKQRVSAFSENQLHLILRSRGIDTLVFFGISRAASRSPRSGGRSTSTTGALFSGTPATTRTLKVHRVLTEKVFPRQATVLTVDPFIRRAGGVIGS